ncbi:MAG: glycosyltransferase [Lapillicoccus sp.]
MKHVFLTRYNLPSAGVESQFRARDNWLRDRTVLFNRYTVPSMKNQLSDEVSWIVYIDPASPAWLVDHLGSLEADQLLTAIPRASVSREELVGDIRTLVGEASGPLITTNIDNDDALARDFSERLRSFGRTQTERCGVYIGRGLVLNGARLYLRRDPENAFCSVVEDLSDPVTCWVDWHNRLSRHMPVITLEGDPGWLQVIHDVNVSNIVRGRRVPSAGYRVAFPRLLDDVADPSQREASRELLLTWPLRTLRDALRTGSRRAAVRLLGKNRFDALKERRGQ